jgi:hypoxanthine phosphoribosyltransferase
MHKEFLPYTIVRNNALKLSKQIADDGFIPDVIYVSLRGGAYMGNVISEYFKLYKKKDERPVYYAAVVARSYTGVRENEAEIRVEGWTYDPRYLRVGDKVLLIDDIFDTGHTINYLANIILDKGIPRRDLKVAVHDYKHYFDKPEQLPIQPDYWCRKHDLSVKDEDRWIHYMSHELVGLSDAELEAHYYNDDPELRPVLSEVFNSAFASPPQPPPQAGGEYPFTFPTREGRSQAPYPLG